MSHTEAGRIMVRNVPPEILASLSVLAARSERSLESEARLAIKTWVETQLQPSRSERALTVAKRLNLVMSAIKKLHGAEPISPSRIALALGFEHAAVVESWFSGDQEPSFKQLGALADLMGCNASWLMHGEKSPFVVEPLRLPRTPLEAVARLMQGENGQDATKIVLVRSNSPRGELSIVCCFNSWKAVTYRTPLHISEEIGASGESDLAWFFLTLKQLYRSNIKANVTVSSFMIDDASYDVLGAGGLHAITALREARDAQQNCWWEDIWDPKQYPKHDYWPGWVKLAKRIEYVIESFKKEGLLKTATGFDDDAETLGA